eukprot:g656.t1
MPWGTSTVDGSTTYYVASLPIAPASGVDSDNLAVLGVSGGKLSQQEMDTLAGANSMEYLRFKVLDGSGGCSSFSAKYIEQGTPWESSSSEKCERTKTFRVRSKYTIPGGASSDVTALVFFDSLAELHLIKSPDGPSAQFHSPICGQGPHMFILAGLRGDVHFEGKVDSRMEEERTHMSPWTADPDGSCTAPSDWHKARVFGNFHSYRKSKGYESAPDEMITEFEAKFTSKHPSGSCASRVSTNTISNSTSTNDDTGGSSNDNSGGSSNDNSGGSSNDNSGDKCYQGDPDSYPCSQTEFEDAEFICRTTGVWFQETSCASLNLNGLSSSCVDAGQTGHVVDQATGKCVPGRRRASDVGDSDSNTAGSSGTRMEALLGELDEEEEEERQAEEEEKRIKEDARRKAQHAKDVKEGRAHAETVEERRERRKHLASEKFHQFVEKYAKGETAEEVLSVLMINVPFNFMLRGGDTAGLWEMGSSVAIQMVDMPFFFFSSLFSLIFGFTPLFVLTGAKFSQWSHRSDLKKDLDKDDKEARRKVDRDTPFMNYVNGNNDNNSPHYVDIVQKLTPTLMFMLWVAISLWIAWSRLSLLGESIGNFDVMDIAFGVAPPFKVPSLQMPIAAFSFSYGALRFSGLLQQLTKHAVKAWVRAKKVADAAKALEAPSPADAPQQITEKSESSGFGDKVKGAAKEELQKRASKAVIDAGDKASKASKDLEGGSPEAEDNEKELAPGELRRWGK